MPWANCPSFGSSGTWITCGMPLSPTRVKEPAASLWCTTLPAKSDVGTAGVVAVGVDGAGEGAGLAGWLGVTRGDRGPAVTARVRRGAAMSVDGAADSVEPNSG